MKILLTGGLGYIGSSLTKKLSEHHLIICSKSEHLNNENFKNTDLELVNIESDNFLKVVEKHKPDLLIHLASYAGLQNCENNPHLAFATNVYGTYNVIKACSLHNVRLIFLSSREVYGNTSNEIDENQILKPTNVYGLTKQLSEKMIVLEHEKSNLNYTILRVTNVYGPGGTDGVNKIIQSSITKNQIVINGGNQLINLIYIDDLVEAIIETLNNEKSYNQIFNVGSFDNITIDEFSKLVSSLCKNNIQITYNTSLKFENSKFKPNVNKIKNILNFDSKTHIKDGIKKTIRWFEQNMDKNKN